MNADIIRERGGGGVRRVPRQLAAAGEEWALMPDLSRAEHAAPGSDAAIAAGCRCPVLDNCHGAGIPWPRTDGKDPTKWPSWYVREDCPLHGADSGWVNP